MLDRMLLASTASEALYVEDVFSTYLYTGTGATQTITNGIDLAGKGGLVWIKRRSSFKPHYLCDTARGAGNYISTSNTNPSGYDSQGLTSFTATGFTLGSDTLGQNVNYGTTETYTSWTFREAPKFFDVVTWTGNGSAIGQFINHSLGVAPGFIVGKRISGSSNWITWHRANGGSPTGRLNNTGAFDTTGWISDTAFAGTASTRILVAGTDTADLDHMNVLGATYVAYLFAHDPTADGIIQCGSFTTDSGGLASVNLGWEPQWVMVKSSNAAGSWQMIDTMRGWYNDNVNANDARLWANLTNAEQTTSQLGNPTATGFDIAGQAASTSFVYIAIRRGPMKTPTVGTSVFAPQATTGNNATSSGQFFTAGFPVDMSILTRRNGTSYMTNGSRLAGTVRLYTNSTSAQDTVTGGFPNYASNTGFTEYGDPTTNTLVSWMFRRAPGFFDVVAYTGTGVANTQKHNLGVAPELIIIKSRSTGGTFYDWSVGANFTASGYRQAFLNTTSAGYAATYPDYIAAQPTATTFSVYAGSVQPVNATGVTYIAYLFASCPGVSKVGSYTGNGSSQTINCGFSSGARFFLVKRTDSIGDWWVYDSARGIVAAADPALRLNSTAAEVTSADAVDTDSTGIIVNQEATCNINVNGATYIYLAIA